MDSPTLDTDYLVIGAGALGMAFVDELIHNDPKVHVTLVERRATPGGHWNDAYPFVRLHQPALYYGVNSEPLGSGGDDLASKGEILGYYDSVLKKLLKTGRLVFLPQCDHEGEGRVRSLVAQDRVWTLRFRKRLVDATHTGITVPSTTPPSYDIDEGVSLVPINGIASLRRPWRRYVVIGAGKTGMDAVLHLLGQGVSPEAISWVISRRAWLIERAFASPKGFLESALAQIRCFKSVTSIEELFLTLEEYGFYSRIDTSTMPTAYRCATVASEELTQLRSISHTIHLGRVTRLTPSTIQLDKGEVAVGDDTLFIDCSSDGLPQRAPVPIFEPHRITLQPVVFCQPTYSGALIARVERQFHTDELRNHHCLPVPHPSAPGDLPSMMIAVMTNMDRWGKNVPLLIWMLRSRLNGGAHAGLFRNLVFGLKVAPHAKAALDNLQRLSESGA